MLGKFSAIILQINFSDLFSPSVTAIMWMLTHLILSLTSCKLYLLFFSAPISWIPLSSVILSSALSPLLLNYSSVVFNSIIMFFNSVPSVWNFLIFPIFLLKFSLYLSNLYDCYFDFFFFFISILLISVSLRVFLRFYLVLCLEYIPLSFHYLVCWFLCFR